MKAKLFLVIIAMLASLMPSCIVMPPNGGGQCNTGGYSRGSYGTVGGIPGGFAPIGGAPIGGGYAPGYNPYQPQFGQGYRPQPNRKPWQGYPGPGRLNVSPDGTSFYY
jgi:hypothetical protein